MFIDMWYGNKIEEVDKITVSFSDLDCEYRGNCYIGGKCVGDFSTQDSLEIGRTFSHLTEAKENTGEEEPEKE